MPSDDEVLRELCERAQRVDVANRPPMTNWSRVPDDQMMRIVLAVVTAPGTMLADARSEADEMFRRRKR